MHLLQAIIIGTPLLITISSDELLLIVEFVCRHGKRAGAGQCGRSGLMQEETRHCVAGCILLVCSILSGYLQYRSLFHLQSVSACSMQYSSLFSAVPLVALPPAVPVSSAACASGCGLLLILLACFPIFLMDPIWTIFRPTTTVYL